MKLALLTDSTPPGHQIHSIGLSNADTARQFLMTVTRH